MTVQNGRRTCVEFPLEFEGDRAFVIWDTIHLPGYRFKARLEIDPCLLKRNSRNASDYDYLGDLVLPLPANN